MASNTIGGVLSQEGKPVAYESRKLKTHELNYPTHDLELLAVVHAVKLWHHYLLGNTFKIKTDHKSLKWIFTKPNLNMRQRRWLELLHEYDSQIECQSGKDNVVANALSRKSILSTVTMIQTSISKIVRAISQEDPFFKKITSTISISNPNQKSNYG